MSQSHACMNTFFKHSNADRDQLAQTPESLYESLREEYGEFNFDPCPPNPTFDGLSVEWGTNTYVNPPYNQLKLWLLKALLEWKKGGKQIIFLMPVRIHTSYFLDYIQPLIEQNEISMYVLRGGVRFKGYKQRAPFGMMYLHFPKK